MTKEKPSKTDSFACDRSFEYTFANLDYLPVSMLRDLLRQEIRRHPYFVLISETGSGKTSCLPPLLLELRNELHLSGGIAVTQPRRVAARSITSREADMFGCQVGDQVGYHIRFEDLTSPNTDITFMTDGILLRKIQFDPLLTQYAIVMIDEAHERSLNIDLSLGLLKEVNQRRAQVGLDAIRIVITSATIERNRFAEYLDQGDGDNSLEIPGKIYPVVVHYENEIPPYYDFLQGAADKVKMIIDNHLSGDILIFMPGKKEISDTIDRIKGTIGSEDLEIIPLHAELSPEEQDRIFTPLDKRKVIVATNIAETSVTIDGIIFVIDSGLIKQTYFDPRSGIQQLVLTEHAISGIDQRKGRAGRTAPGVCFRLYTEESLQRRPKYQTPEIRRSDLSQVVLAMKKVGIQEINNFPFLDQPDHATLSQALQTLKCLGALDERGNLTEIGDWLVEFSLEPHLGRMLIEAMDPANNCVNEITVIASLLDGKNIFVRPSDKDQEISADKAHDQFKHTSDSDILVLLNIWIAFAKNGYSSDWAKQNYLNEKALEEAKNVRLDLLAVLANHGIFIDPLTLPIIKKNALGKAITAGLLGNVVQCIGHSAFEKLDGTKRNIFIHPSSIYATRTPAKGSLMIAGEIFMNPQGKAFACNCMDVKIEWLQEIAPPLYLRAQKNLHSRSHDSSDPRRHSSSKSHRR